MALPYNIYACYIGEASRVALQERLYCHTVSLSFNPVICDIADCIGHPTST